MPTFKRIISKPGCSQCSKPQTTIQADFSFENKHLQLLLKNGFSENVSYTKLGIIYVEDTNLIGIGPIGGNKLQIKCKNENCNSSMDKIEEILK
jgi:hypothetical protein